MPPYAATPDEVDLALRAAIDEAGDTALVGEYYDTHVEDGVAVTISFVARDPSYRGWLWSVTVARATAPEPTVSEVVLLPGTDALLAPEWVPWDQRVRAGDLGVGDLLPPAPDDPRLVPGYLATDDPAVEAAAFELGLGRVRVLSRDARIDLAERWHDGPFGPDDDMAQHAPGRCITCAFYLPLGGWLGQGFGACGNELSPADSRVVDARYGCGAHSETVLEAAPRGPGAPRVDELALEIHRRADGTPELESVVDASDVSDLDPHDVVPLSGSGTEPGSAPDAGSAANW